MNVGTLTISLTARTASLAKAAAGVKAFERGVVASVQRMNASISSIGMAFSALTIPIVAVGIGSTKMFTEFEYQLHRIEGLIGKSENQVKQWGKEILGLAPKLGASANEMSKSLYNIITSDPYRSSELNMELLEKSTKAAEAGLGDMEGIARTAAYAMNAFGTANVDVSKAIDTIIFGVKEGVVTSEEYASALGKVLPAAQKVGMQFHEVAAATAAITRTGNNARESITQIRRMLFTLVQAPEKGKKALNEMNSSYSRLIQHIKDKGFLSVLQEIKNMTELKGEDFMSEIFPNIRALLPVIDLLGE
ncbi:MAG: phage tail tape measure protein, partial [Novosphingobium sp.]|nr:phage tail tape measure protein [Novosphingobium sp.]